MNSPNDDIGRERCNFYTALGFAISNFAQLEFGMMAIFDAVNSSEWDKTVAIFYSFGSTRTQLSALDALVKISIAENENLERWKALRSTLNECILKRDSLAHGEVVSFQRSPEEIEIFFSPRFLKNFHKSPGELTSEWNPAEKFTCEQLIEIGERFVIVGNRLCTFANDIRGGPSE